MQCDYSEMDWYCVLPKGHKGEHRSHSLSSELESLLCAEETRNLRTGKFYTCGRKAKYCTGDKKYLCGIHRLFFKRRLINVFELDT